MQISNDAKRAILNCLQNAAWASGNAQTYYNALAEAFFPVTSISAVYTQSGTVTESTPLDDLKSDLVVTATYEGGATETVPSDGYTLSGTLETGTSTVTVTYASKTTTFTVTVTGSPYVTSGLIHHWDGIDNTGSGHSTTTDVWKDLVGNFDLTRQSSTAVTWGEDHAAFNGSSYMLSATDNIEDPAGKTVEVVIMPAAAITGTVIQPFYNSSIANTAIGKISLYSDNTVGAKGQSGNTYNTGLSSITDVRSVSATISSASAVSKVYINGTEASLSNKTHSLQNTYNRMVIGASKQYDHNTGYYFTGKVFAVRIYDRNLSADEVAQNYATDVSRFGL